MARVQVALLLLVGLAALATGANAHAGMCSKKKGWESFPIEDGKVTDTKGATVLQNTAGYVVADMKKHPKYAKDGASCPYGATFAIHECMKPVIKNNVVQYGAYDSLFKLSYVCADATVNYRVRALAKVGRKGQLLGVTYTAKPLAPTPKA